MPTNDFLRFFLSQQPRAAFFDALQPFTGQRRRVLEQQYDPLYGQFQGEQVNRIRQEGPETQFGFQDFLGGQDFNQLFYQQPRFDRGASSQFFNPRTRWLLGF